MTVLYVQYLQCSMNAQQTQQRESSVTGTASTLAMTRDYTGQHGTTLQPNVC
jgi:hypothetical protein